MTRREVSHKLSINGAFRALTALPLIVVCPAIFAQVSARPNAIPSPDQTYVPRLAFDVASIRENKSVPALDAGSENPAHNSKFVARSLPARYLVQVAYGLYPYQIIGGPDWFGSAEFNIRAKSDGTVDGRLVDLTDDQASQEKQHMLQTLLLDRFGLRGHWETKEMRVYELVVRKGGPKLQPAGSMPPTSLELTTFGAKKIPTFHQNHSSQGLEDVAHGCSMTLLADALWKEMGTTVVDKTGLTATYDFRLQYDGAQPDARNDDSTHWPALVLAISDQLGLKLEPAKGPVQVLVIDHMDKPSEN